MQDAVAQQPPGGDAVEEGTAGGRGPRYLTVRADVEHQVDVVPVSARGRPGGLMVEEEPVDVAQRVRTPGRHGADGLALDVVRLGEPQRGQEQLTRLGAE